ncbi:MAG: hypothetical protein N2383_08635 [Caldilineales bacterium]|nr:hypothetical protein [Caldilineales bacterium]
MYPKAEILFPVTLIPRLRNLKGPGWAALVERISPLPEMHPDKLAFCLLMIRLDGCLKCYSGSYKFMRGCEACAVQSVMQFKGSDEDLLQMYAQAQRDLAAYLSGREKPTDGQSTS